MHFRFLLSAFCSTAQPRLPQAAASRASATAARTGSGGRGNRNAVRALPLLSKSSVGRTFKMRTSLLKHRVLCPSLLIARLALGVCQRGLSRELSSALDPPPPPSPWLLNGGLGCSGTPATEGDPFELQDGSAGHPRSANQSPLSKMDLGVNTIIS